VSACTPLWSICSRKAECSVVAMATTGPEGSPENGADRTVAVMILRGYRVLTLECIGSVRRVCCEHCTCVLKLPSQTNVQFEVEVDQTLV
jgi:hypothetical protein